jgi:hypothetical protein
MKRFLAFAAAFGLTAASAEAGCSKSSLNGLWGLDAGGATYTVSISNGAFYFNNDKFTISSLSGSTCRGNGTYVDTSGPTNYPAKFALEGSARNASGPGNRLIAAYTTDGGVNYQAFVLTRR